MPLAGQRALQYATTMCAPEVFQGRTFIATSGTPRPTRFWLQLPLIICILKG